MARHKKLEAAEDEDPKLDISSLIDVCFLLLIYFIVATSLVQERKLDMAIPGSAAGAAAQSIEPALIRIIKDGTIYWGKDNSVMIDNNMSNHNLANLVQQLETKKQEANAVGAKPVVQLWIEGDVPHQRVVDVINALTEAGIDTVALTDLKDE
jgi:biopolymer transport protein ExbD